MYRAFVLLIPFLSAFSDNSVDLENKNLDIKIVEPKQTIIKTEKDYIKKEDNPLNKSVEPLKKGEEENTEEEGIKVIDGGIEVDKENKTIKSINLNLGTKF